MNLDEFDELVRDAASWQNLGHLAGGAALFALIHFGDNPITTMITLGIFGWLREGAQHRDEGAWVGWITSHRMVEALAWAPAAGLLHAMVM